MYKLILWILSDSRCFVTLFGEFHCYSSLRKIIYKKLRNPLQRNYRKIKVITSRVQMINITISLELIMARRSSLSPFWIITHVCL